MTSLRNVRVKPKQVYKQVLLVMPDPAKPIWHELFSVTRFKIWPLAWEGKVWIEQGFYHGALQTRVVRRHWPHQDATDEYQEDRNLATALLNQGFHVLKCNVVDDMVSRYRGRELSGAVVLTGAILLMMTSVWATVAWYVSLSVCAAYAIWARVMLRGGFGNVAVAKMVCGVANPFILTRYQLVRHMEGRKELIAEPGIAT